jgi:hypothetical protein
VFSSSSSLQPTVEGLPAAWAAILIARPLHQWSEVPDYHLPIPPDFIATRAYYLFLEHDRQTGRDWANWFAAEADMRATFRELVAGLQESGEDWAGDMPKSPSSTTDEPIQDRAECGVQPEKREEFVDSPRLRGDKMGYMDKKKLDVRVLGEREAAESLRNYRDPVARMTQADRERYSGKLLGVLCETGEIIAAAATEVEVEAEVERAGYRDCAWRIMGGPTDATPVTMDQFLGLNGEAPAR